MPLLCRSCHARCRTDRCSWFRHCRKLWRCRSCSSSIRHLCRGAETDSHGPVQDHRNSPVATAAVVTTCSSSADCPSSAAPMCCGGVCVAMSCGGEYFSPDGAYDFAWYSVKPTRGSTPSIPFSILVDVGCVCMLNDWIAALTIFAPTTPTTSSSS